eukprot:1141854-Pelagomonas_calceolata.AAC.5
MLAGRVSVRAVDLQCSFMGSERLGMREENALAMTMDKERLNEQRVMAVAMENDRPNMRWDKAQAGYARERVP